MLNVELLLLIQTKAVPRNQRFFNKSVTRRDTFRNMLPTTNPWIAVRDNLSKSYWFLVLFSHCHKPKWDSKHPSQGANMRGVSGILFSWKVWSKMQVIQSNTFRVPQLCENSISGSRYCTIALTAQNRCGLKLNSLTNCYKLHRCKCSCCRRLSGTARVSMTVLSYFSSVQPLPHLHTSQVLPHNNTIPSYILWEAS